MREAQVHWLALSPNWQGQMDDGALLPARRRATRVMSEGAHARSTYSAPALRTSCIPIVPFHREPQPRRTLSPPPASPGTLG